MRPALLIACTLAVAACERTTPLRRVDRALISVSPKQTIRTDELVDAGRRGTFVLVDVDNRGDVEALVTLTGHWEDASGVTLGPLRRETLRIPPAGRRTFALVDAALAERPAAAIARIDVIDAAVPANPPTVRILEGKVYTDQGRAVVAGYVSNSSGRAGKAVVIAGFHDADGKPMTRPFTLFEIGGHTRLPVRFVGPPGSRTAYIFVGDVVY